MLKNSVCLICLITVGSWQVAGEAADAGKLKIREMATGCDCSLRGSAVAGKAEAWVTGSKGTVLRTVDGGKTWRPVEVPDAEELDFRDIEILKDGSVLLMAAGPGEASKLLRSIDSGMSWKVVLQNHDPNGFFDGLALDAVGQRGVLYGDPIDGQLDLYITSDGGKNWKPVPRSDRPKLQEGEYGFAASGSGISVHESVVCVATGGEAARVWRSQDWGRAWTVAKTPVRAGNESSGIFSMVFLDAMTGLVVGGDYRQPELDEGNVARSLDGGKTWLPQPGVKLEHKACVRSLGQRNALVCGRTGVAVSWDAGETWQPVECGGYYTAAIDAAAKVAYLAGSEGRVAKIEW